MEGTSTDELAILLWNYNNLHQAPRKSDVILALGSHDTRVAERAAELFLQNYAPIVVFSGGFGRLTADSWTKPEADIFAEVAIRMRVPKEHILIENKSTNTEENMRFSMKRIADRGIPLKSVLLVQKPYMERRAYATWKKLFPETEACVTSPQLSYEEYCTQSGMKKEDIIHIIVGDTQRIKEYPSKGFMISQEMPVDVWSAYEELVRRGFTNQLITPS